MNRDTNLIYSSSHSKIIDRIIVSKRFELVKIINDQIKKFSIDDVLDIGTTADSENKSSNLIVKNLENIKHFKSISDQEITSSFFERKKKKSIT